MELTIAQRLGIRQFPFVIKDENGFIRYKEESDNSWFISICNPKGLELSYENSTGYFCHYEYDENGNEVYSLDSAGVWERNTYDSNGKLLERTSNINHN